MNHNVRVLLFAHPRSGSSSLFEILQLHPELEILAEPFNEAFTSWRPTNINYLERVSDIPSLDKEVEEMLQSYNGIKVLSYQLPQELNDHLLLRGDFKIIFLRRLNLLQTVVSLMIAHQTNLWKKWDMTKELQEYYQALQPLDIDEILEFIRGMKEELDYYDKTISVRSPEDVIRLTYEGFYFASPEEQEAQLAAIWQKLGISSFPLERSNYYLRHESAKLNSVESYQLLPNAQEIEEKCGNDATGWLFK